ncbi:hypothetical protein OYC64_013564 [Pagothenia borchgrevinki]|uniref:Uncharacterized protein n=1 Tax=Pagothenia borchgrevinki TaxID=8213 RepID=A0ABD2FV01_PAGBO
MEMRMKWLHHCLLSPSPHLPHHHIPPERDLHQYWPLSLHPKSPHFQSYHRLVSTSFLQRQMHLSTKGSVAEVGLPLLSQEKEKHQINV